MTDPLTKDSGFCRRCGASIPPRHGEGTCPACDPEGVKRNMAKYAALTSKPLYTARHPAAFINAIADEGTKAEAVEWLQRTWDDLMDLRADMKRHLDNHTADLNTVSETER